MGVAAVIEDGNLARRGGDATSVEILRQLGLAGDPLPAALAGFASPAILDPRGERPAPFGPHSASAEGRAQLRRSRITSASRMKRGASSSAGRKLATRTALRSRSRRATPINMIPPADVMARMVV